MLLFSVSSGECYSPSLIQSTYFIQGRKGLAPNLVGSGIKARKGKVQATMTAVRRVPAPFKTFEKRFPKKIDL